MVKKFKVLEDRRLLNFKLGNRRLVELKVQFDNGKKAVIFTKADINNQFHKHSKGEYVKVDYNEKDNVILDRNPYTGELEEMISIRAKSLKNMSKKREM